MNTKKWVLIISTIYAIYFITIFAIDYLCNNPSCRFYDSDTSVIILFALAPLIPLFFLSLITYRLRDEIFTAWWNFARWWVLAIVIITFILNSMSGGGTLGMDRDFTAFTLIILYSILSVGSLVKITRTHVRLRGEEKGLSPVEQDHLKRKTNLYIIAAVVLFIVVLVAIG